MIKNKAFLLSLMIVIGVCIFAPDGYSISINSSEWISKDVEYHASTSSITDGLTVGAYGEHLNNWYRGYILINLSNITSISPLANITNITLAYSYTTKSGSGAMDLFYANTLWVESNITTNMPCGVVEGIMDTNNNCNLSAFYQKQNSDVVSGYNSFNITERAKWDVANSDGIFTIVFMDNGEASNINYQIYDSINSTSKPTLIITYQSILPSSSSTINNTLPRTNDDVQFTVISYNTNYVNFAWNNTGWANTTTIVNGTTTSYINKTITASANSVIGWYTSTNDSSGNWYTSPTQTFRVGTNVLPTIIINPNNFFNVYNGTGIGYTQSSNVLLNLSFIDDIGLAGFQINISNPLNSLVYNITYVSPTISGLASNFSNAINVQNTLQGYYNISISVWDIDSNYNFYKYSYYLSYPNITWSTANPYLLNGNSFTAQLSVNGNWKNTTRFSLYNSSYNLTSTFNLTYQNNNTYIYEYPLSGLTGLRYYLNATHYDRAGESYLSEGLVIDSQYLNNCSAGYPTINFTFRDELYNQLILTGGYITFSFGTYTQSFSNTNNFSVCIFPSYSNLTSDITLYYSATNYPQRRYSSNMILSNSTQNLVLYLLNTSIGIPYARFQITDAYGNSIVGATGSMTQSGESSIIEVESSDSSGLMTFFVNPDQDYTFTFSKSGYPSYTVTLRPTTSEIYSITLGQSIGNTISPFTGISYDFSPDGLLNNGTTYRFTWNVTSSYWNITACTLLISNNSISLGYNSSFVNSSYCAPTVDFNTGKYESFLVEGSYTINNTDVFTYSRTYSAKYNFVGNFTIKNALDDMKRFSGAGFNNWSRFFLAFIIITLIVVGISKFLPAFGNEESVVILIVFLVIFFGYLGWMRIDLETLPTFSNFDLKQWIIPLLVTLLGGGYLIEKEVNR